MIHLPFLRGIFLFLFLPLISKGESSPPFSRQSRYISERKILIDDTRFVDEPDIVQITRTGVVLRLYPLRPELALNVSAYFVIVECHKADQNRTIFDSDVVDFTLNYTVAKARRLPLYAAIKVTPEQLKSDRQFVIGDDQIQGDYSNPKLNPDRQYRFGIAAQLTNDRFIYKKSSRTIIPRQSDHFMHDSYTVWLLFALFLVILVLLVVVVLHLNIAGDGQWQSLFALWGTSTQRRSLFKDINASRGKNRLTLLTASAYEADDDDQSTFLKSTNDVRGFEIKNHPILVAEFPDYVKSMMDTDILKQEYQSVPRGQWFKWDTAKLPRNRGKNRYGNMLPYDYNRVVLEVENEEIGHRESHIIEEDNLPTDYINASFIEGYKAENRYIATQGPLSNTIGDFWRMVWQAESKFIVMLTNVEELGKMKCDKYWPDDSAKYGSLLVKLLKTETFSDYIIRKFALSKKGRPIREVLQYHFISWPDHNIPLFTNSVISFMTSIRSCPEYKEKDKPIIAHCSAGVGRTGTFIMIDTLLDMAKEEEYFDILAQLCIVRSQRINMVEKLPQYVFVHQVVAQIISPTNSVENI